MEPHDLREAGEYLFGDKWQSKMARMVNVKIGTFQRWAADPALGYSRPVPGWVEPVVETAVWLKKHGLFEDSPLAHRAHQRGPALA